MTNLIKQKIFQATDLLKEFDVDVWLIFVRETTAIMDPMLPMIYSGDMTWQSAILLHRSGENTIIIGHYEAEAASRLGAFQRILGYHQSIKELLIDEINRLNPKSIAINYSTNDSHADGLTHGLYLQLLTYLDGTGFTQNLVSAEKLVGALRSRKTPDEIRFIKRAVQTTEQIFREVYEQATR